MALFDNYARGSVNDRVSSTPNPITIKPISSEAPSILKQAIEYYKPGGEFAGIRSKQLEAKKGTYTAAAEAQLVGRGLAGTTVGAAIPGAFEQEVATPWRTETEMFRGARLMEAVLAQAGYSERQTAREQEVAIANAQMELQQRLANKQISVQEYNAATSRLAARGGGGSDAGTTRQLAPNVPRQYVPGLGMTSRQELWGGGTGGDEFSLPPSLLSLGTGGGTAGGGEPWTKFPAGGGEPYQVPAPTGDEFGGVLPGVMGAGSYNPYTYSPEGHYIGGLSIEAAKHEAELWRGDLANLGEKWLTEPSKAAGY